MLQETTAAPRASGLRPVHCRGVEGDAPAAGTARSRTCASGPRSSSIPVKAFHQAKRRLGPALTDPDRGQLVRAMATHVVSACAPLRLRSSVTTRRAAWAADMGAAVMWEPGQASTAPCGPASIAWPAPARVGDRRPRGPAPRPGSRHLPPFEGVTLVPDRRDDGTNVLRLPAHRDFRFAYGPGSFRAHRAEATRLGLAVRVLREPDLAYDVDWPADVVELGALTAGTTGGPKAPGLTCSEWNGA